MFDARAMGVVDNADSEEITYNYICQQSTC